MVQYSGGTSTTTPGMQRAAGILANTQTSIQNGVNQVAATHATLMSTWTGDASNSFSRAVDKWSDDAWYIIGRLGDMIELLDQNRHVISTTEANNLQAADHIQSSVGLPID